MMKILVFFLLGNCLFAQQLIGPVGNGGYSYFTNIYSYDISSTNSDIIYIANAFGGLFEFDIKTGLRKFFDSKLGQSHIEFIFTTPELDSAFFYTNRVYGSFGYRGDEFFIVNTSITQRRTFCSNPLNPKVLFENRNIDELWRSNDCGENWHFVHKFPTYVLGFDIPRSDTSIIYTAIDNAVYRSTNSGTDWNFISSAIRPFKIKVNPYNADSYLIATIDGLLISDTGRLDSLRSILNVVGDFAWNPIDTNEIYAVQYDDSFMKTTNKGETWIDLTESFPHLPGHATDYNGIKYHPDSMNVVYTGTQYGLYKTTNSGENWFPAGMPYTEVFDIQVNKENNNIIFAGHQGFGITKTSDGGKHWYYPNFTPEKEFENFHFFSMNPFSSSEAMLAGKNGIYKTTDAGDNWNLLSNPMEGAVSISYHPYVKNLIYVSIMFGYSTTAGFYRSTDNGEIWEYISLPAVNNITYNPHNFTEFYSHGHADDYHIIKFSNNGEDWEFLGNDGLLKNEIDKLLPITCIGVSFTDPNILYCGQRAIGQDRGGFSKSTDGGESWFQIDSSLYPHDPYTSVSSVYIDSTFPGRIFIGLQIQGDPWHRENTSYSNGGLYITEDDGKNWEKIYDGNVNFITRDNATPPNLYCGTKYGIMKMTDTFTVTAVKKEDIVVNKYQLFQNYPNPFNPATTITYQIPVDGFVSLKIYDILGREVKTLVNEYKTKGRYEVTFDASNLASGMYIYEIKSGDYKASKKMTLIK